MKTKSKATPSTGKGQELVAHIVPCNADGSRKDKALCGALWDRPVNKSNNICEKCQEIYEKMVRGR